MARRLPIYFLLDVSESMAGTELESLRRSLKDISAALISNPYALETVWVSVIVFAGKAKTVTELTQLPAFTAPNLSIGGGTSLGAGLEHLMKQIDRDRVVGSQDQKGDWKPVVYLITDGRSTDNVDAAIKKWNDKYRQRANMVAISIGGGADVSQLQQLTDDVLDFDNNAPDAFAKLAQWVTTSVSIQSQRTPTGDERPTLDRDDEILREVPRNSGPAKVDEKVAVLVGKCAQTRLPYLFKFKIVKGGKPKYQFVEAVALDSEYTNLSIQGTATPQINTSEIDRIDSCPHCSTDYSLCICLCGEMVCNPSSPCTIVCPWCNQSVEFAPAQSSMQVNRKQG